MGKSKKSISSMEVASDMQSETSNIVRIKSTVPNVVFESKRSSLYFKLVEAGDEEEITIDELKEMMAHHRKFLTKPWIIVEDEALRKKYSILQEGYELAHSVTDITWLTSGPERDIEARLDKIPKSLYDVFISNLAEYVKCGKLTNYNVIKSLEERFGIDFKRDIQGM